MTPTVHIAGRPVIPISDLVLAAEFGPNQVGGPSDASFTTLFERYQRPSWLAKDAPGWITLGGKQMFMGITSEVDLAEGKVSLDGLSRESDSAACIDAAAIPTSIGDTAVSQGIARGALRGWRMPTSLWSTPITSGDTPENVNYITDLLKTVSTASGRPVVSAAGIVSAIPDPSAPGLYLLPGTGELSWASEGQATRLIGQWNDGTTSRVSMVGSGSVEQIIDMTPLGAISSSTASSTLANILADLTVGAWTGSLVITSQNTYGRQDLSQVFELASRGLMVRHLGMRDPRPGSSSWFTDLHIQRAEWAVDARQITLTPRAAVARDLSSVLADYGLAA